MSKLRKISVVVGLLFLTSMIASTINMILVGPLFSSSNYLVDIGSNKSALLIGMLLELVCAIEVVWLGVMMYPVLAKRNEHIARGYLGLRVMEAAVFISIELALLGLLTLSTNYLDVGSVSSTSYDLIGRILLALHGYGTQLIGFILGIAGVLFYYVLHKEKLLPGFITWWGGIGYILCFVGTVIAFWGYDVTFLYIPSGLNELFLGVWLIVVGFIEPSKVKI